MLFCAWECALCYQSPSSRSVAAVAEVEAVVTVNEHEGQHSAAHLTVATATQKDNPEEGNLALYRGVLRSASTPVNLEREEYSYSSDGYFGEAPCARSHRASSSARTINRAASRSSPSRARKYESMRTALHHSRSKARTAPSDEDGITQEDGFSSFSLCDSNATQPTCAPSAEYPPIRHSATSGGLFQVRP